MKTINYLNSKRTLKHVFQLVLLSSIILVSCEKLEEPEILKEEQLQEHLVPVFDYSLTRSSMNYDSVNKTVDVTFYLKNNSNIDIVLSPKSDGVYTENIVWICGILVETNQTTTKYYPKQYDINEFRIDEYKLGSVIYPGETLTIRVTGTLTVIESNNDPKPNTIYIHDIIVHSYEYPEFTEEIDCFIN